MPKEVYTDMTGLRVLTDPELVTLAQGGDSEAFGELVRRYENKIYRLARRMTDSREDAEDVLQEAFIKAFTSISGFKGMSKFSTWLYRIVVNTALMKRRVRRTVVESLDEPITTKDGEIKREIGDEGCDPLTLMILKESRGILDRAMEDLYPTSRAVFVLRYLEGMSTEETGRVLNISLAAVKSRLHRSRLALRRRLIRHARRETMSIEAVSGCC
jgi:RNA polymerase sigma-70 factor (ECF subfamily)